MAHGVFYYYMCGLNKQTLRILCSTVVSQSECYHCQSWCTNTLTLEASFSQVSAISGNTQLTAGNRHIQRSENNTPVIQYNDIEVHIILMCRGGGGGGGCGKTDLGILISRLLTFTLSCEKVGMVDCKVVTWYAWYQCKGHNSLGPFPCLFKSYTIPFESHSLTNLSVYMRPPCTRLCTCLISMVWERG